MSVVDDITDCVILHYDRVLRRNDILSDTDIKTRFNFSASSWAAEAEALSELGCVKRLNVRIPQSSMNANTTPEEIGRLVDKLVEAQRKKAMRVLDKIVEAPPTKAMRVVGKLVKTPRKKARRSIKKKKSRKR